MATITTISEPYNYGTVRGGGVYESGKSVTLKAVARSPFKFAKWDDGSTDSKRVVTVSDDITYTATFEYYIEEWLKGKFNKVSGVTDDSIMPIIMGRDVTLGTLVEDVTVKNRELCYADLLVFFALSPSSQTEKMGQYSSALGITNPDELLKKANQIYRKYGEPIVGNVFRIKYI